MGNVHPLSEVSFAEFYNFSSIQAKWTKFYMMFQVLETIEVEKQTNGGNIIVRKRKKNSDFLDMVNCIGIPHANVIAFLKTSMTVETVLGT